MEQRQASERIEGWADKRVGVVGDLILDRYVWGSASRISQEAPIPVVEVKEVTVRPGGAANVLHNLVTLGAQAVAFGVLGRDANGDALCNLLAEKGIDAQGVLRDDTRVTTEKTRIVAANQQVVRVDTEKRDPLSEESATRLLEVIRDAIESKHIDGLIIEDYAKGVLNKGLAQRVVELAAAHGVPVALDPHPANHLDLSGLTLMTPNRAEAFSLAGAYHTPAVLPVESDAAFLRVAKHLHETWQVECLLITMGADGMALFLPGSAPLHVPTQAREVFDVSGAGDTVISSFMLAFLAGAPPQEAAVFSNHAAGVVVGKVGTAPVHAAELLASFALGE